MTHLQAMRRGLNQVSEVGIRFQRFDHLRAAIEA